MCILYDRVLEMVVTMDRRLKVFDELVTKARRVIEAKIKDYGYRSGYEAFRSSVILGIPPMRGVLIRMLDKLIRINNLIEKDPDVSNESLEDTIIDIVNYAALLSYLNEERQLERHGKQNSQ